MHQIVFCFAPDPTGGAYSAPRHPSWLRGGGETPQEGEVRGKGRKGKKKGKGEEEVKGRIPIAPFQPNPLDPPLTLCALQMFVLVLLLLLTSG